jgi:ABC-2 type transport system ATP-binding protein
MPETILKATNVTKIYGKDKVLDKVSIKINRGMIYGLIGENGEVNRHSCAQLWG